MSDTTDSGVALGLEEFAARKADPCAPDLGGTLCHTDFRRTP